jgi:hypothetical protein
VKTTRTLFLVTIALAVTTSAQTAKVSASDLKPLEGKQWIGSLTYLDYSSNNDVKLSADGRIFDGESVVERTKLPGGVLKIVTTKPGKDNNRDATFRHTYLIGKAAFSIKKEVRIDGTSEFFERNTYSWTR